VLTELGIDVVPAHAHILEVWNKVDLLPLERLGELQHDARRDERHPVLVSAVSGLGLDDLLREIDTRLGAADEILDVVVPGSQGQLINWLYENTDILNREATEEGALSIKLRVASEKKARVIGQLRKAGVVV